MPNYPTHARWGRMGAVVVAVAVAGGFFLAFDSLILAGAGGLGAGLTTFVGSIFPDVDHHNSVPRRKAVRALRVLVWVGVVALAILSWDLLVSAIETAVVGPMQTVLTDSADITTEIPPAFVTSIVVLAAAVALAGLTDPAIDLVTDRHRGWTHSVAVTFLLTLAIVALVWLFTSDVFLSDGLEIERRFAAVGVVGTFYAGILIHLGLDGEIL